MRLGPRELGLAARGLEALLSGGLSKGEASAATKLLAKLRREQETKLAAPLAVSGASAGPIHQALVEAAAGRVPDMGSAPSAWWANLSRQLARLEANPEQARLLGAWLATQTWSPSFGWNTILKNWRDWHARAELEARKGPSPGAGSPAGGRAEAW